MASALTYLRSFKIAGFAAIDFIASFVILYYLAGARGVIGTVPLSVLVHWIFDIDTPLNSMVGL